MGGQASVELDLAAALGKLKGLAGIAGRPTERSHQRQRFLEDRLALGLTP